jgi:hypothetical protein
MEVYKLPPIDAWDGMVTLGQYFAISHLQDRYEDLQLSQHFDNVLRLLFRGMECARRYGDWEGDVAHGVFISAVPTEDGECKLMLAWKQSNNGDTYVVSEMALPWLGERLGPPQDRRIKPVGSA